jgi:hypothetical protein
VAAEEAQERGIESATKQADCRSRVAVVSFYILLFFSPPPPHPLPGVFLGEVAWNQSITGSECRQSSHSIAFIAKVVKTIELQVKSDTLRDDLAKVVITNGLR